MQAHERSWSGLLTEVFHLKCQNNFPLNCCESVLEILFCHCTHKAVSDMWHQWTHGNLRGGLGWGVVGARVGQYLHVLSASHVANYEQGGTKYAFVMNTRDHPNECFLESLQSQPLTLFLCASLAVIWSSGECFRAAEALVSAARGTSPCVTICNIIKKSVLCFIQAIRANQSESSVGWGGRKGGGGLWGCWGLSRVCYSSVSPSSELCLDCCVWIEQIGLHLTL